MLGFMGSPFGLHSSIFDKALKKWGSPGGMFGKTMNNFQSPANSMSNMFGRGNNLSQPNFLSQPGQMEQPSQISPFKSDDLNQQEEHGMGSPPFSIDSIPGGGYGGGINPPRRNPYSGIEDVGMMGRIMQDYPSKWRTYQ